jgi:hypothetical protein
MRLHIPDGKPPHYHQAGQKAPRAQATEPITFAGWCPLFFQAF